MVADERQFEMLFNLEKQLSDPKARDAVWNLIGQLKTNPKLYLSLLKNENLAERLGGPSETSTFKLLYCLQIIQSLLSSNGHTKSGTMSLYYEAGRRGYGSQMQD
jgi:hypothetical protein